MKKKNHYLGGNNIALMPELNPVIEKSSSGILSGSYRYTYVTNNPLKYTDPSGYTYYRKRFDWENSVTEGMNFSAGAGGSPADRSTSWYDIYREIKDQGYDISMEEAIDIYDAAIWDSYNTNQLSSEQGDLMVFTNEVFYHHLTLTSHDGGETFQISDVSTRRESYSVKIIIPSQELVDQFNASKESGDLSAFGYAIAGVGNTAFGISMLDGTFSFRHGKTGRLRLRYYKSGWSGGSLARIKTYNLTGATKNIANGANLLGTAIAYYRLAIGEDDPLIYVDAGIGTAGLAAAYLSYFHGIEVPYVGEVVALYGLARMSWDIGTGLRESIHPDPWFNKQPEPRVFDIDWNP